MGETRRGEGKRHKDRGQKLLSFCQSFRGHRGDNTCQKEKKDSSATLLLL